MKLIIISLATFLTAAPASADALKSAKLSSEILEESSASDWRTIPAEEMLVIELAHGKVTVALSPALARAHVEQIKKLAREGFYDGLSFYRVIDGFVAQGGDPFSEKKIRTASKAMKAEFDSPMSEAFAFYALPDADGYAPQSGFADSLPVGVDAKAGRAWHLHCSGAISFARDDGRDTASTEFYITLQPQRYLDRNTSVFGRVIDGMQHLQALRRVNPPMSKDDDLGEAIVSMRVAADIPAAQRETFEILDSASPTFAAYIEARRNRAEAFFYHRPDYIDVCQAPIPVREKAAG